MERARFSKQREDDIVRNIEKLTGKKQATFEGHKRNIHDLQRGDTSEPLTQTSRQIIDVTKWDDIRKVMVVPGKLGRK